MKSYKKGPRNGGVPPMAPVVERPVETVFEAVSTEPVLQETPVLEETPAVDTAIESPVQEPVAEEPTPVVESPVETPAVEETPVPVTGKKKR